MSPGLDFLLWVDRHPSAYFWPVVLLMVVSFLFAARALLRSGETGDRGPDWGWSATIILILAAGRWPALIFTRELDPDESQLLAGAHALTHDPVFWRSVNGGTAGPLDFFALWPAGWLCGWDSFLPARLTALALVATGLILVHQVMAGRLGRSAARLATLMGTGWQALSHAGDFMHYSTELVPVALLGLATYAAHRRWTPAGGTLWCGLGGAALGAVPLAKLQPAPLAAALGLVWLVAEWRTPSPERGRRLAYLLLGAMWPAVLFATQLTIAGEWESFLRSYLSYNLQYAAASRDGIGHTLMVMAGNALFWDRLLIAAPIAVAVWLALMVRLRPVTDAALRWLTRATIAAGLCSLAVILLPKRPYLHYWHLFLLPGVGLIGVMIARLLASAPTSERNLERRIVLLGAAGVVGTMCLVRALQPNWFVGDMTYFRLHPRSELAKRVAAWSQPGEVLAIWGRTDHVYVETGLWQATRDSHFGALVEPGAAQAYMRERYLRDFVRAEPAVFLDSTGPANPHYNDPRFAHERDCPELAMLIRNHYVPVDQFEGTRIYRRRDRMAR